MPVKHPDEPALLAYVEEELPVERRREVDEHLAACGTCAEQVRALGVARAALRAAPLLELPEERRAAILAALPERRDPWRAFRPVRRALLVAAPVAAAAAFVGVFVLAATQLGNGGDDDSGEAAQVAEDSAAEEGGAQEALTGTGADTAPQTSEADSRGVRVGTVAGPPAEVVRILAREGIRAVVADGAVVAEGRAAEVRAALAGRAAGPVEVYAGR